MAERDLGQLLFVGFEGVELTVGLRSFLSTIRPGGIILFTRNMVDPEQTLRLTTALREVCDPRPILAVDEEGGQVSRLRAMAPTLPPAAVMAVRRDPALVRDLASRLGRIIASLGFDLDFAPVTDLCETTATNGIGDRSFGRDPDVVTDLASAYLEGLARSGVSGCLKHFPGLGPTSSDSHLDLPTVRKQEKAFRAEDLVPYQRLHSRAPVIMIGHGHYPFWAGEEPIAATLVPSIVTGLLRRELGYKGLALADDLQMKAVADRIPYAELAPRVIEAGCDMALVCRKQEAIEACWTGLRAWAREGRLPEARFEEAFSRLDAFRSAVLRPGAPPTSLEPFRSASAHLSAGLASLA